MEDGSIPDNKLTASSTHSFSNVAWGRLHYSQRSWTANTDDRKQWFQVSFAPEVKLITDIATQGNGNKLWWVKEYYVMYKKGGGDLQEYKENNQRLVSKVLVRSSFQLIRVKEGKYLGMLTTQP